MTPVASASADRPRPHLSRYLDHDLIYAHHGLDHDDFRPEPPASPTASHLSDDEMLNLPSLQHELDTKWILNLSMHFRDKSDREKFFVTYAQTPTKWRRVTVSCDYRDAEAGSLELDLKYTRHQRDKSLQIYEAIRASLEEIQFYDTVTNLKLETNDGRLHVHVTEDLNEAIAYPARHVVRHILDNEDPRRRPREIPESDLEFSGHLSGFVYRVRHQGKTYIKKEIPGPDTIDEFLYEINALHALEESDHVIKLEAIVVDDRGLTVKGLLISHAERGAVVDILYDHKGQVPWSHRERWARQAVTGLRDIHEEGYVQGDFTLSNIVVDADNNAQIIDINRRGCPVGWEPPEIAEKISSNQRISMYIGEKSDVYQLGMSLWALAMDDDEPERHDPPLSTAQFPSDVPQWFANIVRTCLSERPKDRKTAKELVHMFPPIVSPTNSCGPLLERHSTPRQEKEKLYIDPEAAVERDDIERFMRPGEEHDALYSPQSSKNDPTFTWPKSSDYGPDCGESTVYEERRGRQLRRDISLSPTRTSQGMSAQYIDSDPSARIGYDELELDGTPYRASRVTCMSEQLRVFDDRKSRSSTRLSLPLRLTMGCLGPLQLPVTHRSLSEDATPRTSLAQLRDIVSGHESSIATAVRAIDEDRILTEHPGLVKHFSQPKPRNTTSAIVTAPINTTDTSPLFPASSPDVPVPTSTTPNDLVTPPATSHVYPQTTSMESMTES